MPAINPKSLPANLQPGAPARNLTPQEMRMAVAQMKAPSPPTALRSPRRTASGLNPDDSPVMPPRAAERPPVGFVEEAPPQMPMGPNRRFSPPGRLGISRQYAKGGSIMEDLAESKREVDSLKKRYPKKGIDPTIPAGIRVMLVDKQKSALTPDSKYAKGGKIDGCAQRGKTKGRFV